MALIAYNKTTSVIALDVGNYGIKTVGGQPVRFDGDPPASLPVSAQAGVKGPGVDVTNKLRGLTPAQYATLQVLVAAGSVAFEWIGAPQYSTYSMEVETDAAAMPNHGSSHDTSSGDDPITVAVTSPLICGHERISAPIAAELVTIVADVLMSNVALTIAAQPAYPRKLQVRITDANSSISAGIVTIVGKNAAGESVTETVALTGGTATKNTVNAYATVTSATISALAGNAAGDNIGIGVGPAFGMSVPAAATDFTVYKSNVDGANETVGTVDATAKSIAPTTAANASRNFDFWYSYKMPVAAELNG